MREYQDKVGAGCPPACRGMRGACCKSRVMDGFFTPALTRGPRVYSQINHRVKLHALSQPFLSRIPPPPDSFIGGELVQAFSAVIVNKVMRRCDV